MPSESAPGHRTQLRKGQRALAKTRRRREPPIPEEFRAKFIRRWPARQQRRQRLLRRPAMRETPRRQYQFTSSSSCNADSPVRNSTALPGAELDEHASRRDRPAEHGPVEGRTCFPARYAGCRRCSPRPHRMRARRRWPSGEVAIAPRQVFSAPEQRAMRLLRRSSPTGPPSAASGWPGHTGRSELLENIGPNSRWAIARSRLCCTTCCCLSKRRDAKAETLIKGRQTKVAHIT